MFVKALGKYIGPKSGTRNLLIIDGVPYHLKQGLAEYFNYGVVQSYNSRGYQDLQGRFDNAAKNGWKPEQYIFAETFEGVSMQVEWSRSLFKRRRVGTFIRRNGTSSPCMKEN